MAGILKKVLRAAVAQPWDYVGEGAPDDWEFRVSPNEQHIAMYVPSKELWWIFHRVEIVREVSSLDDMDRITRDWRQFLSLEDPED